MTRWYSYFYKPRGRESLPNWIEVCSLQAHDSLDMGFFWKKITDNASAGEPQGDSSSFGLGSFESIGGCLGGEMITQLQLRVPSAPQSMKQQRPGLVISRLLKQSKALTNRCYVVPDPSTSSSVWIYWSSVDKFSCWWPRCAWIFSSWSLWRLFSRPLEASSPLCF